jgi:outer membrane cobalamin receptor
VPAQVQSQQPDSTQTVIADSIKSPLIPIPLVGSIDRELPAANVIHDSDLQFFDYRSLTDIISTLPGTFVRDLGTPGLSTGLTLNGIAQNSIAFLSDGVLLNEPMTGVFNLALYPTEQIERIEIIPMTRAFLYANNSTGGAINLVSKSKRAIHPQSRIRYSESAYGYGFIDGMVSQDIIRGLNVTAGLQHTTYDGRFPNSDYDAWNARFKLRYNISNAVNIFASEMYNSTQQGLNGGISSVTPDSLRFEERQATVNNTDSYEKLTRHDLQLGAAVRPDFDSSGVNTLTLYLSTNLREYRDEENRPLSNSIYVKEDHRSQWYGVRFMHERTIGKHSLDIGAEVQSRAVIASPTIGQARETQTSLFGLLQLKPTDNFSASGYARFDNYFSQSKMSFGFDGSFHVQDFLEFFGGYSHSYKFPALQQYYETGVFWNNQYMEEHSLFETGISIRDSQSSIRVSYHNREISGLNDQNKGILDALIAETSFHRDGFTVDATYRFSWLLADVKVNRFLDEKSSISLSNDSTQFYLPKYSISGGIYFFDKLINDHLQLKTGLQGTYFTGYNTNGFNQQHQVFSPGLHIGDTAVLDLLLIAHLGDAYIHFIWENLLNRKYITADFYPMPDRAIRFGVSWDFLD